MNDAANEVLKPGYPGTRCIKVPNEWIMDGMEVFSGSSTGNAKRLAPAIDAGYVTLTENFLGRPCTATSMPRPRSRSRAIRWCTGTPTGTIRAGSMPRLR